MVPARRSKLDMEQNNIQGITDSKLIAKLQLLSKEIVANEIEMDEEWVRDHKWTVVPTESDITVREAEWISNACSDFEYKECYAIMTEADACHNFPDTFVEKIKNLYKSKSLHFTCYKFATTKKGFLEMSYEHHLGHHLFIPEDQGFAILRPYGLYSLVAGPKKFVEAAVGSTIETAREMFWEFASTDWGETDRLFLTEIARKYQSVSAG